MFLQNETLILAAEARYHAQFSQAFQSLFLRVYFKSSDGLTA